MNGFGFGFSAALGTLLNQTVPPVIPDISSTEVTAVTDTSFTVTSSVDPYGAPATVTLEIGTSTGNYNLTPVEADESPVSNAGEITFKVTGLSPYTDYYFRIKAVNEAGTAYTAEFLQKTEFRATLISTGTGAGVSTLKMEVSENQTIEIISGTARFYTDAAGTLGESTTWSPTTGALRTIYLKAPSGSSTMRIYKPDKVTKWGNSGGNDGWTSGTNAAQISIYVGKLALTELRITGATILTGALPTGLTYLLLSGNSIAWTYTGALPTGLTYLYLLGSSIAWTYTGALPTGLTSLSLPSTAIAWKYTVALSTELTYLHLSGSSIAGTYTGALPTGWTGLGLSSGSIAGT